ncbi:MAG: TetR/AcrR family transcriptional regulator [Paludibacter sp.]|jgi:AcrR family transcriptional regulator|nr:TetR/AcrR family transcriptional regulator [Paludibacter sp.]
MAIKIQKTKLKLIETARVLFAEQGKKNITMNDIAEASGKSRRSLYTHFKNKDAVYHAVINYELSCILEKIQQVSKLKLAPDIKLTRHIITHLDAIKESVQRNGSLRADFFMDIYAVERARRINDKEEHGYIRNILKDGIEKRVFKRIDADLSATIILYAIKGLEVPYIRQNINEEFERNKQGIVEFILTAIKHPTPSFLN